MVMSWLKNKLKGRAVSDMTERYGKVVVLLGGNSAEREVSLISGQAVHESLLRSGVHALAIDAGEDLVSGLLKEAPDRVFNVLHGRGGEDGCIQGVLETMGIPYTGSGVLASALSMDKALTKRCWQSHGLPTPLYVELDAELDSRALVENLGLPIMVKPAREGSSVGASKVMHEADLMAAYELAAQYDNSVLAERWITGMEFTVPVLSGQALPVIKLETDRDFYDYYAKYEDDKTRYICPCGLSVARETALQELACKAFDAVGASGWGRVDLMVDEQGDAWLIEVNTVPGMTSHSLVPMSAREAGMSFDELVLSILDTSLEERA